MKDEEKTREQLAEELADALKRNREQECLLNQIATAKGQWENTVDCISDLVFFADPQGRIQRCNKTAKKFIGQNCDKIFGRQWLEVFMEHGMKIDGSSKSLDNAEVLHLPTGRCFIVAVFDYRDPNSNETLGHVVTLHDVTEIKTLAESLEIMNATLDKDRQELHFALDEISFLLQAVEKERDLSLRFKAPDTAVSDPIYQIGERFNSMMNMLESGHRELEKAYTDLKSAQSQILQQEKMASIGQLAAGIAHEINNPTGFILSNLNTLMKYYNRYSEFISLLNEAVVELADTGDENTNSILGSLEQKRKAMKLDYVIEDTKQLIRETTDGAERIKKIVQDLKNFSHIDSAEWKMADINAGLESTINIVWNELKYKAVLKREYGDVPATYCNIGQLNQVFVNLLVNAAQAIDGKGEITIKTWEDAGYVHISVSDTGFGIPPENLTRIFEPFFTTKDVGKGTGLGLSVAYDIVKKHNGTIKADSIQGKGTVFTIRIPIATGAG